MTISEFCFSCLPLFAAFLIPTTFRGSYVGQTRMPVLWSECKGPAYTPYPRIRVTQKWSWAHSRYYKGRIFVILLNSPLERERERERERSAIIDGMQGRDGACSILTGVVVGRSTSRPRNAGGPQDVRKCADWRTSN